MTIKELISTLTKIRDKETAVCISHPPAYTPIEAAGLILKKKEQEPGNILLIH